VTSNNQPLRLTPKEYGLLELFLRNPHRIFSTGALIAHIWSFEEPPTEDTIRSHIKGLRQKLKAAGALDDPIETVYGIGYRLRPAEENSTGAKKQRSKQAKGQASEAIEESKVESQTTDEITNIWQQVKEAIDRRVAVLEQAVALLFQNKLSEELRQQAERDAHKLAGSLGMFGSDEGSRLAQEIETLLEKGVLLDCNQTQHLTQLVTALRHELQCMNPEQLPEILSPGEPIDERPWLLIVSANRSLSEQLATEAASWGMRSQITSSPVAAREQISDKRPNAVLLDFVVADTLDNHLMLLAELSACTPPVPALVLTDRDSLIDRVKIARLGGRRVLQQPVTTTQVLEAVNQVLQNTRQAQAMVMVVDDDPQVLMALQRLLIPWGLYVCVLENPLLFLDTLEATPPDILVLDVEMPHISGIELCQVVRNDPRWSGLPILFLTSHADPDTMHRVFAAGADDYVRKPIVGPELVTRILNRLERSRLLRTLSETDALTGVANRRKSTLELTQFLLWSRHCHQPFCFAIVKLDHLQLINQQYGHAATDEVLARFGEMLRQIFHSEDVVGRWGGGEFVVGMSGMTKKDGVRRVGDLRKTLHQFEFRAANGTSFRATFSVGVVQYPQDGSDLQALYQAASAVLAKDVGGDSA
jgi:diguanylate cyclase (GGDEF)-like protein